MRIVKAKHISKRQRKLNMIRWSFKYTLYRLGLYGTGTDVPYMIKYRAEKKGR